jgi:hypothetical protein
MESVKTVTYLRVLPLNERTDYKRIGSKMAKKERF